MAIIQKFAKLKFTNNLLNLQNNVVYRQNSKSPIHSEVLYIHKFNARQSFLPCDVNFVCRAKGNSHYNVCFCIYYRVDDNLRIKVGDFGLARDVYSSDYYRANRNAKLPVKWMPPETLHDSISNEKTDVVCYQCNIEPLM